MLKLRLPYFGHIMRRQYSPENIIMMRKVEDSRKRGGSNMRWTGSIKEATGLSLQDLSRTVEDRTFWRWLIHRVAMSWRQLDST